MYPDRVSERQMSCWVRAEHEEKNLQRSLDELRDSWEKRCAACEEDDMPDETTQKAKQPLHVRIVCWFVRRR